MGTLGRDARRIANRKIVWYCCPGHDGWAFTTEMKKRFKRIARRRQSRVLDDLAW